MDLGWHADGIERARAAGGVELELYRRPGFTGGLAVRRIPGSSYACGFDAGYLDEEPEAPPEDIKGRPR